MILQLFKRSLKEHLGFHLLIPVLLVFAISAWSEASLRTGGWEAWATFARHWPASHIGKLVEVYVAFFLVVGWSIKLAGDVQSTRVETVRDLLPTTKRYFAHGVIPMREWFEPNTAVYLGTIIHHQVTHQDFSHERVLLFTRETDLKAVSVSYLDEPYAKAFAALHKQFGIPLAYLSPTEYRALLARLTPAQRNVLGCERSFMAALRRRTTVVPISLALRRMSPFVLLEQTDGSYSAMRFTKSGRTLILSSIEDQQLVAAVRALVDQISATVYWPGTKNLKEQYNFISYLQL